ncbi:MAG: MBL fold metallo-hydrolase [Clostridia bacterium]|nr:MBL fold metallo-hydrolase [Clostridia bacterium]
MKDFYCVKDNTWCIDTGHTLIGVYRINDRDIVMLDSGISYGVGETGRLMTALDGAKLNVKAIVATHGHWDHIGNNKNLVEKYGCKVYMYGDEAYACRDEEGVIFSRSLLPYNDEIKKTYACMTSCVHEFIDPDAEYIEICGKRFGIVHTPGHSSAHITIITEDNVAMAGDVLMTENEIVKTKIPYAANFAIDFRSKRKLASLNCDKYIISHRGIREDIEHEVEANINYLKGRAEVVLSYIEDGMTYDDIVAAVINCMNIKVTNRFYFSDIHGMVMPYVQYLEETGRVYAEFDKGYVRYTVID